jgi:hypothetical protein
MDGYDRASEQPSRDRVPPNPNDPAVRLARQVEGGGCAGDGFGYQQSLLKLFGLHIDSQKRQVFNLRNALRAGRALSTSMARSGSAVFRGAKLCELTQSRSQTQGLEKADKPEFVRRDDV